jgi:CysZ protein
VISAFFSAARQLGDPRIKGVIVRVAVWTSIIFGTLGWILWAAIAGLDFVSNLEFIPFDWLRNALAWLADLAVAVIGGLIFVALFWLLFVAVVQLVSGFYLERVIAAVEARHYPHLPAPRPLTLFGAVVVSVRFLGAIVLLNLLILPVYLIPVIGWVVVYLVNGYLFGREYFELTATRRRNADEMRTLRGAHRGRLLASGLVIALLFALPLINLLAPIVAAAAMVHVFEAMPDPGSPAGGGS